MVISLVGAPRIIALQYLTTLLDFEVDFCGFGEDGFEQEQTRLIADLPQQGDVRMPGATSNFEVDEGRKQQLAGASVAAERD